VVPPGVGGGAVSAQQKDAMRAGFHSILSPPEVGEEVICLSETHYKRRGCVLSMTPLVSDGTQGLIGGEVGLMVTVQENDGSSFTSYAVFLASINDKEYSSICTPAEFGSSSFFNEIVNASSCIPTRQQAMQAVTEWLQNLTDAEGNRMEVSAKQQAFLIKAFEDQHQDASLHLYSMHAALGPRTEADLGRDYSTYYRALNNTLNHDETGLVGVAMPLLRRMIYLLLFDEGDQKRIHPATTVYKGDSTYPAPLNMVKLKEAVFNKSPLHFRQFTSATSNQKLAQKCQHRENSRGFLWIIEIPDKYWGARDIKEVAAKPNEDETLFPPYSEFYVKSVNEEECHLVAVSMRGYGCCSPS